MDHLPADVREYLLSLLTALGQMNHITSKVECEHVKSRSHIVPHNGIMSMSVGVRAELLDKGWSLLGDSNAASRIDVSTSGSSSVVATATSGPCAPVPTAEGHVVPSAEPDHTLPPL